MEKSDGNQTAYKRPRSENIIFTDLELLCAKPGFIHAIAYFCFRDNLVLFKSELTPGDLAKLHTGEQLCRTEIATLIGLFLRSSRDYSLPTPARTREYIDEAEGLLHELHTSMASDWFKDLTPEKIASGFDPFSDGSSMREPIFYGGDSAYSFQYRDFSPEKYKKDASWLLANKGFEIDDAIKVAEAIAALQMQIQLATANELKSDRPDSWSYLPGFTFSIDELTAKSKLDRETVTNIVNAFCVSDQENNTAFLALSDFNINTAQPIIRTSGDTYILFQHYSLLEAIYESPFYWMAGEKSYANQALANRGEFTEEIAFRCLRRSFGHHVYRNVHIERAKGDTIGEIDVLVVFGGRAIVLQAKSKRLTLNARRGNDLQLKSDFKKAVQDAYDQAFVCCEAILGHDCRLRTADGTDIHLDHYPEQALPICVVSDHYPALAFQARQFLTLQEKENIAAPIVTDIFALDAMTEMLPTPLLLLSYLDLRRIHAKKVLYAHELVLLSTHLKRNLWVDSKYDMVAFDEGLSAHLDAAMLVRRNGAPGKATPEGILTRFRGTAIEGILRQIILSPTPDKVDVGLQLLSLDQETAETINEAIAFVRRESIKDGENHDFTAILDNGTSGITLHCNTKPDSEAAEKLATHCALRKYSQKSTSWFGLLLSPSDGHVRLGINLAGMWEYDEGLDKATKDFVHHTGRGATGSRSLREVRKALKPKKPGRNEMCPCGSGKKYKKCCRQ